MPRGNFLEASKGGVGFQEGFVHIDESFSTNFQYPPNSQTGKQSDPFCALVWRGTRLDSEWNELPGDDNQFEIVLRMGSGYDKAKGVTGVRPGKLAEKDFDNLDVEPEDLGSDVGVMGNSFFMEEGQKFSVGWEKMKESLEQKAFKKEILGRGIATDFVGMIAHFKTVEGQKYIASKGDKKGQEVTPSNLVCDRIHTYPYDAKKKGGASKAATGTSKANGSAAASASASTGTAPSSALSAAKDVFSALSAEFKKAMPADKAVPRAEFQKQLTKELMRQKINPKVQVQIMDLVKDDNKLMDLAADVMDMPCAFTIGDDTITFTA
jgi:hypothetical protein